MSKKIKKIGRAFAALYEQDEKPFNTDKPKEKLVPQHAEKIAEFLLELFFPNYHVNIEDMPASQILWEIEKLLRNGIKFFHENTEKEKLDKMVDEILLGLLPIREMLKKDVVAAYEGDPAAQAENHIEIIMCYPGFFAITIHRVAHLIYDQGAPFYARFISEHAHRVTGIDIHPGAKIGESFFIDHGTGVVIGETTEIGNNVRIYQGVTLGAKDEDAESCRGKKRHPTIEDNVIIFAGATVYGGKTRIGKNSKIMEGARITKSVPPNTTVYPVKPENITKENGNKPSLTVQ